MDTMYVAIDSFAPPVRGSFGPQISSDTMLTPEPANYYPGTAQKANFVPSFHSLGLAWPAGLCRVPFVEYIMKPETVDKVRKRLQARKKGGPKAAGEEDPWSCDEAPPDLFYVGLEEFNEGLY